MRITAPRAIALICICSSISACVPILPHRYYRPDADGGEVQRNVCWGTYERIRIHRPGVIAEMKVMKSDGKRFIETQVEVQPGKTVELMDSNAQLFLNEREAPLKVPLHLSSHGAPVDEQPLAPLVGGYLPPPTETYVRNVWLYLTLPDPVADSFEILIPQYSIDGHTDSLPIVRFKKETSVQFIAPIQC